MKKTITFIVAFFIFSTSAYAQDVSRSFWISYMQAILPEMFCQHTPYFKQCFDVTYNDCITTVRVDAAVCLNDIKHMLPETLNNVTGKPYGTAVGACAGEKYEARFANRKTKDQQCDDPSFWMQKPQ